MFIQLHFLSLLSLCPFVTHASLTHSPSVSCTPRVSLDTPKRHHPLKCGVEARYSVQAAGESHRVHKRHVPHQYVGISMNEWIYCHAKYPYIVVKRFVMCSSTWYIYCIWVILVHAARARHLKLKPNEKLQCCHKESSGSTSVSLDVLLCLLCDHYFTSSCSCRKWQCARMAKHREM